MAVVMYDLDGTLLDTASEIAQAVNLTLKEFGRDPVTEDDVRNWIGHGTGWLMKRAWESGGVSDDVSWESVRERFIYH